MNAIEFRTKFGYEAEVSVNPLTAVANRLFGLDSVKDYRVEAIRACLREGVAFVGDENTQMELARGVVDVRCPYGHGSMTLKSVGGTFNVMGYSYVCPECGTRVSLKLDADAVSVTPPEAMSDNTRARARLFGVKKSTARKSVTKKEA